MDAASFVDKTLAEIAQDRAPDDLHSNYVYNGFKKGLQHMADVSNGELEFFGGYLSPNTEALEVMGIRSRLKEPTVYHNGKPLLVPTRSFRVAFAFREDGSFGRDDRYENFRYTASEDSRFERLLKAIGMKPEFDPDNEIQKALVEVTKQAESWLYIVGLNRPKAETNLAAIVA